MTIRASSNIQDLIGSGEEWLVVGETIIAKFFDGNFQSEVVVSGNDDVTKEAA